MQKIGTQKVAAAVIGMLAALLPHVGSANSSYTVGMFIEDCDESEKSKSPACLYYLRGVSDAVMESWAVRKLPCEKEVLATKDEQSVFGAQGKLLANVMSVVRKMQAVTPVVNQEPAAKVIRLALEGFCPFRVPEPK